MVRRESRPSTISHITLGTKQTGAPSAGNLHAGCDVAGAGNGFTVWLLRHSPRKRGGTARLDLRNTAPVLDPTEFDLIVDSTYIYQPKGWVECRNQATRLRVLILLMRWSGLAIRDAVTLERRRLNDKDELFLYRAK